MNYHSRSFSRSALGDLLAMVSGNAKMRWPSMTRMMTGDVAWQLPGAAPQENIRLWYDDSGLAGYAWFQPPDTFTYDLRVGLSDSEGLADGMLAWAEEKRSHFGPGSPFYIELDSMAEWADRIVNPRPPLAGERRCLVASAFESDPNSIDFLERNGFAATKHFEPFLRRDLEKIPALTLPEGMTIRHVQENDFEQRVETHRAAWWPASGFTMERYLEVREVSAVFDPELDLVAEANDGSFASSCICWADPISQIGSFEPFGTRPEWRGTNVSRALTYEGLRRLKAKGMRYARIYTAGFNHQALRLYQSCGFELVDRSRTYMKTL